jgi:lysozyme family protein
MVVLYEDALLVSWFQIKHDPIGNSISCLKGKSLMAESIYYSVGKGGRNHSFDVKKIQTLLNASSIIERKLIVDGQCGPQTLNAIVQYQMSIFYSKNVCDGRIEPQGKTLKSLNTQRLASNKNVVIGCSVGKGGKNFFSDVKKIQTLLNASLIIPQTLVVDGRFGPRTFNAILQYQMSIFNSTNACDGRIDPNGKTLRS